jgi:hypothetical protein
LLKTQLLEVDYDLQKKVYGKDSSVRGHTLCEDFYRNQAVRQIDYHADAARFFD